jgi:hypothetical protein
MAGYITLIVAITVLVSGAYVCRVVRRLGQ